MIYSGITCNLIMSISGLQDFSAILNIECNEEGKGEKWIVQATRSM
jgi:hypothetical protein